MSICRSSITLMATVTVSIFAVAVITGCSGVQERNTSPEMTPAVETQTGTAEAVLSGYRQFGGEVVDLSKTAPTVTVDASDVVGTIPASSLTQGNPPCAGFIQTLPSLVFTLEEDAATVEVAFAGNTTTTLIVVGEGDEILCDETAPATLTPTLTLTQLSTNRYGVWVGRTDMQEPVSGRLTVTLLSED